MPGENPSSKTALIRFRDTLRSPGPTGSRRGHRSLQWTIFVQVTPVLALFLVAIVVLTERRVHRAFLEEVRGRLEQTSIHISEQLETRLTLLGETCRGVAHNDIVIHGIVDLDHRRGALSSFFQSLRLPGPSSQVVTMLDYRGRAILSTGTPPKFEGSPWLREVMAGRPSRGIQDGQLIMAHPIPYGGGAEGAIVAAYDLKEFLAFQTRHLPVSSLVFHLGEKPIFASNPGVYREGLTRELPPGTLSMTTEMGSLPGLRCTVSEFPDRAWRAYEMVTEALTMEAIILILGLAAAIWMAARIAIRQLNRFISEMETVESTADLSSRVSEYETIEFERLARGFNAMLEELEKALVSRTELREANEELQRSNRDLQDFTYVASHDLRSPLRAIDNLARWIREDEGESLSEVSVRHLELIQKRVTRLEKLLEDLLRYSDAGKCDAHVEQVDLRELIETLARRVIATSGFEVSTRGVFPVIFTWKKLLEVVIRQLVENAIKHHDRPEGRIRITGKVLEGFVEFRITDDGPGIDSQFQDRIFEAFKTLKPRDEVEGSGMGLALVRRTVDSVGGRVEVESDGRGSCFRLEWPISEEPETELEVQFEQGVQS